MHSHGFLQDFAVVLLIAAIVTVTFRRLHLPVVLGYILAGVIIGPHTPPVPLISDQATIHILAELGIHFMLFALGLEFHLERLKEVGVSAFLAASFEIPLMMFLGYSVGRSFGWSSLDCVFLGAAVSISSTTIIVKTFAELQLMRASFTQVVFGILIFEDVLGIFMLALLSTIGMTGGIEPQTVLASAGRLLLFVALALITGFLAIPRLLRFVGRFHSNEMLLLTTVGLCFGLSLVANLLQLSSALGAFIMGTLVARTRHAGRVELLTEPLRDLFVAVFFVSVGLTVDPKLLLQHLPTVVILCLAVVLGKAVACSAGALLAGNERRTALRVGTSMGQIGEFSFVIATLGLTLGVISKELYPIVVGVSVVTTFTTPLLVRRADRWITHFEERSPRGVIALLDVYHAWTDRLPGQLAARAGPELRAFAFRALVNVTLIASTFIGAAALSSLAEPWLPRLPAWAPDHGTLFWLGAASLTMPLFIGTFRKLWTISRGIAELGEQSEVRDRQAIGLRTVVGSVLFGAASGALFLMTLLLSVAIIPPFKLAVAVGALLALFSVLFRQRLLSAYGRIQSAIHEELERPAEARERFQLTARDEEVPSILDAGRFETVHVVAGSTAVGRGLEELALRRRTGASVIAIERSGELIVSPRADLALEVDDRLVLIGDPQELAAARALLEGQTDG